MEVCWIGNLPVWVGCGGLCYEVISFFFSFAFFQEGRYGTWCHFQLSNLVDWNVGLENKTYLENILFEANQNPDQDSIQTLHSPTRQSSWVCCEVLLQTQSVFVSLLAAMGTKNHVRDWYCVRIYLQEE